MGSFSIWHWGIVIFFIAISVMIVRAASRTPKPETQRVATKAELFGRIQMYAAQGYQTVLDRGNIVVMSRRIPFNWVLMIVLLFIPIIGWVAFLILLFGNKNKVHSITLEAPEAG